MVRSITRNLSSSASLPCGIVLLAKHTETGQSQPEAIDDIARIEFCFKGCFLSKAHVRAERGQTKRHEGIDVPLPGSFVLLNRIVVYQPATTVLWIGPDCPLSSRCLQRSAGPETLKLEAQKLVWPRGYLSIAPDGELGNPRPSRASRCSRISVAEFLRVPVPRTPTLQTNIEFLGE